MSNSDEPKANFLQTLADVRGHKHALVGSHSERTLEFSCKDKTCLAIFVVRRDNPSFLRTLEALGSDFNDPAWSARFCRRVQSGELDSWFETLEAVIKGEVTSKSTAFKKPKVIRDTVLDLLTLEQFRCEEPGVQAFYVPHAGTFATLDHGVLKFEAPGYYACILGYWSLIPGPLFRRIFPSKVSESNDEPVQKVFMAPDEPTSKDRPIS